MANIIAQFDDENQARQMMQRLEKANLGEVRMRVLTDTNGAAGDEDNQRGRMISSDLGSVAVRPSDNPVMPGEEPGVEESLSSGTVPVTGQGGKPAPPGVQVLIEVDDAYAEQAFKILNGGE